MKKSLLALPVIGIAACTSQGKKEKADNSLKPDDLPNIVLIMADDVAPLHLSCYGGKVPTPNIDKLAGEGMKFTKAYATASACTPSRYSIITGQYAGRCSEPEFIENNPVGQPYKIAWDTPIGKRNQTLHEILKEAGYYTGYVGKFHIGPLSYDNHEDNPDIPYIDPEININSKKADSLLAIYQDIISKKVKELTGCDYAASIQYENPEGIPVEAVSRHHVEYTTKGAMEFLSKAEEKENPFFLHVNITPLHGPNHIDDLRSDATFSPGGRLEEPYQYHPQRKTIFERLDKEGIPYEDVPDHVKHYHTGIPYMDDHVGIVLNKLKDMGVKENTLVIYTADHGTEPGKSSCYEQGIKVPFIVRWPQKVKQGTTSGQMIQFVDFLPTFAAIAGTELSSGIIVDGKNILPVFEGKEIQRDYLFSEMGYLRAVYNKKYKYIAMRFPKDEIDRLRSGELSSLSHMGNDINGFAGIVASYYPGYFDADELYDLENDPYEQNNLAHDPEYADVLKNMQKALKEKLKSFKHPYPLDDTDYAEMPAYNESVEAIKKKGITVYWWNRDIDFPPPKGEDFYY
jgi:arylsulfatase A-like enzyme